MSLVSVLVSLAALSWQNPSPSTRPVPLAISQRPARDSTLVRAWKVIDSLIPEPAPKSLTRAQAKMWLEQTAWLKSLKARIENLLLLVVAPAATVAPPAPVDPKNIKALQDEAAAESQRLTFTFNQLQARHDHAMNAIRNMK